MFFDTHAHLNDKAFKDDLDSVVENCREAKVNTLVNVGYDLVSSKEAVQLAEKFQGFYAAVGVHPHDAATFNSEVKAELKKLASNKKVVAIGEIGLDYYRDLSPRNLQKKAFLEQLELAKELDLPIIIHDRDAHGDIIDVLKQETAGLERKGILHCFSGSWEMAKICLDLGFYISFAGPVTYKNSRNLPEVAAKVPVDRILIETDCPYLTPEPFRGKRNEPTYVTYVAEKIAQIRGLSRENFAEITTANAKAVFKIN